MGKTYAMLGEGRRRLDRGTDVVVGFIETHGRRNTADRLEGLEVAPRRRIEHRGAVLDEMDLDALLARRPEVALVDELAHTNAPGSRHAKRWEDVEELLAAGIDVISTVNVQHLESLNDVVEAITGVRQRETVPDRVVRDAEQVELVDMTPEALRRRMVHGHIYAPDKVDAALGNYFRLGNLGALRELALLWVADKVDEAMRRYLSDERIAGTWETRERVVVAITGAPSGDHLIRRAARMARRSHGDLIGVHIRPGTGLREGPNEELLAHRTLLADLGGTYHETTSDDVAEGLVAFAGSVRATQIVLGASRRDRLSELVRGSVINRVIRAAGEIDVHVISRDDGAERAALPPAPRRHGSPLSRRRRAAGWALVVVGLPLLTVVLDAARNSIGLPSVLVIYLLYVCIVAAIGGFGPAFVTALASTAAANWYFTQPLYTLRIRDPEHLIAVSAFVSAGGLVSLLVARTARRTADAGPISALKFPMRRANIFMYGLMRRWAIWLRLKTCATESALISMNFLRPTAKPNCITLSAKTFSTSMPCFGLPCLNFPAIVPPPACLPTAFSPWTAKKCRNRVARLSPPALISNKSSTPNGCATTSQPSWAAASKTSI